MSKFMNSGITWTDVAALLTGLQGIHECRVEVVITVLTQGHNGMLDFTVSAWVPTVEAQHTRMIAEVKGTWPNKTHPTFDSCLFNAAYDLDRAIGRAYAQEPLQET